MSVSRPGPKASKNVWKRRSADPIKANTRELEEENLKMEKRLQDLRKAMDREKSERESQPGFWKSGQIGTLSSFGKEVIQDKLALMKKKSGKIKVLREEKIEPVHRSKSPGTIAFIASRGKSSNKENKVKVKQTERFDETPPLMAAQNTQRSMKLVNEVLSHPDPKGSISLLQGTYDEEENAASFQAALNAWRTEKMPTPTLPHKCAEVPQSTDCGTSMVDSNKKIPIEIKFTNSLSYAEKLLLKSHRRAKSADSVYSTRQVKCPEPAMQNTPVLQMGVSSTEAELAASQQQWHFGPDFTTDIRPESSISIIEMEDGQFNEKYSNLGDDSSFYLVSESSDNRRLSGIIKDDAVQHAWKLPSSCQESEQEDCQSVSQVSCTNIGQSNTVLSNCRSISRQRKVHVGKNLCQPVRAKSAMKKVAHHIDGQLTKSPSAHLQQIAKRGQEEKWQQFQPADLGDFFVPPQTNDKQLTQISASRKIEMENKKHSLHEPWKVSNRLYTMSPCSWRPENSLSGEPKENCDAHSEENLVHLREESLAKLQMGDPGRITPNLMCHMTKRLKTSTERTNTDLQKNKHITFKAGDTKSCVQDFDDISTTFEETNEEDVHTLKTLERELAVEFKEACHTNGGAAGHLACDLQKKLTTAEKWQEYTDITGQKIDAALTMRASTLLDDFDAIEHLMMTEEVKALH